MGGKRGGDMGKNRGAEFRLAHDRYRPRPRQPRRPLPASAPAPVKRERRERHVADGVNWKVLPLDNGQVLALEPGGTHEVVFDGPPTSDLFWDAVEYAARRLRGETDAALS